MSEYLFINSDGYLCVNLTVIRIRPNASLMSRHWFVVEQICQGVVCWHFVELYMNKVYKNTYICAYIDVPSY